MPPTPNKKRHARTCMLVDRIFDGRRFQNDIQAITFHGPDIEHLYKIDEETGGLTQFERVIDHRGKTVLPGFIDAHAHFLQMGLASLELDCAEVKSRPDFFELIHEEVRRRVDQRPVIGRDWDESVWSDSRLPSREELDAISPSIPIIVRRVCGHLAVLNSAALATMSRGNFRGDYTAGIAIEETVWAFDEHVPYTPELCERAIRHAQELAFHQGVTTVHEINSAPNFKKYQAWAMSGVLQTRVLMYLSARGLDHYLKAGLMAGFGTDTLVFSGIKVFIDGSLGARTAALNRPYHDHKTKKGIVICPRARFRNLLARCREAGIPIMAHAIGDRAIRLVLDEFDTGNKAADQDLRHRIEHLEVLDAELVDRFEKSGLIASLQPNFARRWSQPPTGMNWERLGPERVRWCNPYAVLFSRNIPVAFGSDCMPFGPLFGLEGAVNHPVPELSVSLERALEAYTSGSAFAGNVEDRVGSLQPGKKADIIVLDRDIKMTSTLKEVNVVMTILDGEIVFER